MSFFDCTICGNSHKLITLLEFPQPDIISKITSGELEYELNVVSKTAFGINREYLILQAKLCIPIIDFEDEFELDVWMKIVGEEYLSKVRLIQESRYTKVEMEGTMLQEIPFFPGTKDLTVVTKVDSKTKDHLFPIVEVKNAIDLNEYLQKGISLKELAAILSPLYH